MKQASTKLNQATLDTAKEMLDINTRMMSQFMEVQSEFARLFVEGGEKQVKAGETVNDPQDFIASQSSIAQEYSAKFANLTEKNIKLATDAGSEMQSLIQKASEQFQK